jgi:pimeloyl-ACP methyl ester carboxylesterase
MQQTKRGVFALIMCTLGVSGIAAQTVTGDRTTDVVEKDAVVLSFRLHYREAGRGPAVILLHGLGGDGSRWAANIDEEVRKVRAPTLIVWGRYDELADPIGADSLSTMIAGSRKVLIDDAGHMPQIEKPDEFNRIVAEFMRH